MKSEKLSTIITNYFNKHDYTVTGHPEKLVLGYYTIKDIDGITYEISADNANYAALHNRSKAAMEKDLLISQDQEL